MEDQDVVERLAAVESRVQHLEEMLGVGEPRLVVVAPPPLPAKVLATAEVEIFTLADDEPEQRQTPVDPPRWRMPASVSQTNFEPVPVPASAEEPSAFSPSITSDFPTRMAEPKGAALEQTIGLKWTGWIGAVVLVMGVAFGIKFAYDQGWFGFVTPAVRVTMLAMGGFALIAAGEVVYRKINRLSAAGLFGAGVAILFVVSYAGYAFYDLYGRDAAFVCMGVSTIIGTLVARRGGMVSIAVLSMIGGNLAPALLRGDHPNLTGFLTYLLLLQLTSLAMSAWGASPRWWVLRGLSLATTGMWILSVMNLPPREAVLFFSIIFAAGYQAELIFSARQSMWGRASAGVTFSILVSAGLSAVMLVLFHDALAITRVVDLLSLAGVLVTLAAVCLRMNRRTLEGRGSAMGALAMGYALQAIALVVVAVPIAVSGVWIALAWCVLAILLATAGYVLDLPMPRVAAPAVWGLAVVGLGLFSAGEGGHVSFAILGTAIPHFVVAAWGLAVGAQIIAGITGRWRDGNVSIGSQVVAQYLSCAGGLVWLAGSIGGLAPGDATMAMLVLGWILLMAGQLEDALNLRLQAGIVFMLAAVKWVVVDTLLARFAADWTASSQLPLLTTNIGVAVLLAFSLCVFSFATRSAVGVLGNGRAMLRANSAAALVLVWAGTMEIDRVVEHFIPPISSGFSQLQYKQLLWTSWWMLCTCLSLIIAVGTAGDAEAKGAMLRRWWKLPAWIAAKFLLLDLLVYRVISDPAIRPVFTGPIPVAAGMVLMGLALLYWLSANPNLAKCVEPKMRSWVVSLAVACLFISGSLAIDQLFINQRLSANWLPSEADHAEQVILSVFWSAFAVISVVAGFIWRVPALRYFSLALFALVLLKVVTVDLSQVSTGYRILSFMVLGLLLLGTSVLYGKLSPRSQAARSVQG